MTVRELGRALRDLGEGEDRVKVLDVDHSATTYQLPQIESRVRVGVYYLRPPSGVTVQAMKEIFDQVEGLAFRYKLTSGIGTDHMELLTPDDYARQYFGSTSMKLIHIEGARKAAREQLEEIFDQMKLEFDAASFPHLDDVTISGYKEGNEELSTVVKLLAYEDDFRNLSKIERAITHKFSENNLHREIIVTRHLVRETKPEIILSTTAKATVKGRTFLDELAAYLIDRDGGIQTEARRSVVKSVETPSSASASSYKTLVQAFPTQRKVVRTPLEIVNSAHSAFFDTLSRMTAFAGLEISKLPQAIHVQFPKKMFRARQFEERDLRELKGVNKAIIGSPGLHEGWNAYHVFDKKERVLKIRFTTPDQELQSPWLRL